MTILYNITHPSVADTGRVTLERQAVRAIVLHGDELLLLYTRRYDDFSFPGGGLDFGESPTDGLMREVQEETGALNFHIKTYLGYGDERRPAGVSGHDVLLMRSHFYLCSAARNLGTATPETYEVSNGMSPEWIKIQDAITHNESVLRIKPQNMGLSIYRETLMLKYVAKNHVADAKVV